MNAPAVDVRRSNDRAQTKISWLDSKHSFSFGDNYDPDNTHHGLLLVNNDDIVNPGTGDLSRPGPADVGRSGNPALGEERRVDPDRRTIP
jgi:hypothetical protein